MEAAVAYKANKLHEASAKKAEALQTKMLTYGSTHQKVIQEGSLKMKQQLVEKMDEMVNEAQPMIRLSKKI
eukprot:15229006-Alexandrium_andersonii.AAC.1